MNRYFSKEVTLKIKVGFPFTYTNRGGSYQSASMIIKKLSKNKSYDIIVFLPTKGFNDDLFEFENVTVVDYNLNKKIQDKVYKSSGISRKILSIPSQIKLYLKALRIFKQFKCDLVHINDDASLLAWGLSAKARKIPVVWNVRQDYGNKYIDLLRKKLASHIIFNSKATSNRFKNNDLNQSIIYNLFEIPSAHQDSMSNDQIITIGFVGTLQRRKRLEWFLKAAIFASNQFNNLRFVIAGPDYSDGEYLNQINQTKTIIGEDSQLDYLGQVDDIYPVFQLMDIFCLTSSSEAFGRVVIEALINNTAVIATDVGGVKEIIDDEYNGILVNPNSYEEFKVSLLELIKDRVKRERLANHGLNILRDKFDPEKQIENLMNVYNSLLESKFEKNK